MVTAEEDLRTYQLIDSLLPYADTSEAELVWSPSSHIGQFVIKFIDSTGQAKVVVIPRSKVVEVFARFLLEVESEERFLRESLKKKPEENR